MRRRSWRLEAAALILTSAAPAALSAIDFPPIQPPAAMFHAHRERFLGKLPPGAIAVLRAAPPSTMSNDVRYPYRQDSDFWYLTGIEQPGAVAVFRPGAPDGKRYVVFLQPRNARAESYEGSRPGPDEARTAYGADAGHASEELADRMARYDADARAFSGYLVGIEKVYLSDGGDRSWAETLRETIESMRTRDTGPSTIVDAREILHELRLVKDADELALIRRATDITGRGHVLAMQAAAPGRYEFEVQQALDGYAYANGVRRMAYPSIVGSGPNSVFLHWERNDRRMEAGDVVLNDSGAEYGYYATDITRTYPVSGRFTTEQRAIYDVVLAAQKAAIAQVRAGARHEAIGQAAARVQTEGLVKLGLLRGDVAELLKKNGHRPLTKHGVSHWVGLDVHDAGRYAVDGVSRTLEPGMVLTVEPGIYVAAGTPGVDRRWWNIGVRVEDVLVVTDKGHECLSCSVPREAADVEKTVQSGRR